MTTGRFAYIWQYEVDPQFEAEFLGAYGVNGEWVKLFSRDSAYLGTKLLRDSGCEGRYATIDWWRSKRDRDLFRERYSVEFNELDERCEKFTLDERFVGDFSEVEDAPV